MIIKDWLNEFVNTSTGDDLDRVSNYTPLLREVYGVLHCNKPNDHCYWNSDFGFWEENDEHFRNRIKEKLK